MLVNRESACALNDLRSAYIETMKSIRTERHSSLAVWKKEFKKKKYFGLWREFILRSVLSSEKTDLNKIYEEIKTRYPEICVDDVLYRGSPRWKYIVRTVLDSLMKAGKVKSVSRGKWVCLAQIEAIH